MIPGPDPFVESRVRIHEVTKSARRSLNLLLPSPAEKILPASSIEGGSETPPEWSARLLKSRPHLLGEDYKSRNPTGTVGQATLIHFYTIIVFPWLVILTLEK